MCRRSVCSSIVVLVLALMGTQTQGSPYDRVAYWDSGYTTSWAGDGIAVRDALQAAGYTVVNAAELKTWMDARIADKKLSVVVFCKDDVPSTVAEAQNATCTIRRYLDAGGKVVVYSDIPFYYQGVSSGTHTNWGAAGSTNILGFNAAGGTWDVNGAVTITEAGARWGLTTPWTSARPMNPTATDNLEVLATDRNGNAPGWVKHYLPGDTFRGFVRIDDHGGAPVSIPQLIAVAEYAESIVPATGPVPDSGATDILRDVILGWTAGELAATHDVYFGTSFDDVNDAGTSDPRGVLVSQGQMDAAFDPEGLLEYGQTYYWRIDEVNGAPDYTVFEGEVWSFTTETYAYPITGLTATASSAQPTSPASKTIDGSGLDELDQHGVDLKTMWVTPGGLPAWIQYTFDKEYKLHELWVWNGNSELELLMGFGVKNVAIEYSTDGETWTPLENVPEFARGTATATYTANNIINLGEVMARYVRLTVNTTWGAMGMASISEVRFFYTPVQAFEPDPVDGATGVSIEADLSWRPGREAASHVVYIDTDSNAVADGAAAGHAVTSHSYTPEDLLLATEYFWKVDEVGDTGAYAGDVWSFTTEAFVVVDDFESYTDDMDAEEAIFQTWIDGYGVDTNGSLVGIDPAVNGTFCETTIVHGGARSMPFFYDNTGGATYAEAKRTFDPAQDWTIRGIQSLSLYFAGAAGNTGQLYVKVNNTKVPYDGSATDLARSAWQVWNIDLSAVGNVTSVRSLTIGIDGSGAAGTLYVDDICLYARTPEYIVPTEPDTANLVAHYSFDEGTGTRVADSSGNGNHGTAIGDPTWSTGVLAGAMTFDGVDDHVDCGKGGSVTNVGSVSVAVWIQPGVAGQDIKIASDQDGANGGYKLGVYSGNSMVEFEVRTSANAATLNRTAPGGTALEAGVWYHVVGVYEKGKAIRTYVNGRLDRELLTTVEAGVSQGALMLGREAPTGAYWWNGKMDDMRIYNIAMSDAEAAGLAGQTEPIHKPF